MLYLCTETRRVPRPFFHKSVQRGQCTSHSGTPKRYYGAPAKTWRIVVFENHPAAADSYCFPIVRPAPKNPVALTVAVKQFRGLYTHWFGGKTIGCSHPGTCDACEHNVKRVWAGHLIGRRHSDDRYVLATFTSPCVAFFRQHERPHEDIFGMRMSFFRVGDRITSPIGCRIHGWDPNECAFGMNVLEKVLIRLYADNANRREVDLQ